MNSINLDKQKIQFFLIFLFLSYIFSIKMDTRKWKIINHLGFNLKNTITFLKSYSLSYLPIFFFLILLNKFYTLFQAFIFYLFQLAFSIFFHFDFFSIRMLTLSFFCTNMIDFLKNLFYFSHLILKVLQESSQIFSFFLLHIFLWSCAGIEKFFQFHHQFYHNT